jgi:L-ascorbate metabolism protein UlaG (beta-lactamase superfamily)
MFDGLTWYRQSAYRYEAGGRTIYIDPWGLPDDSPEADAVFITHAHQDHFNEEDLNKVRTERTRIVAPRDVAADCGLLGDIVAIGPGDDVEAAGVSGQAVPAYNIVDERLDKHPKEKDWVGYVLTLGGRTMYFAGDTDHVPDLNSVKAQVAFVPIGGTYTMDADEAAGLIREIRPEIAVPCHYGFVVGPPSVAERFREACDPIEVQVLEPTNPFELTDD